MISARNRLLNTPLRTRNNRAIEIAGEKAVEIFRLLTEGKAMTFLPGIELNAEWRKASRSGCSTGITAPSTSR